MSDDELRARESHDEFVHEFRWAAAILMLLCTWFGALALFLASCNEIAIALLVVAWVTGGAAVLPLAGRPALRVMVAFGVVCVAFFLSWRVIEVLMTHPLGLD